jgi:hypothetical protein
MTSKKPFRLPVERNTQTQAKFQRETWWQITFPLLVTVCLIFACTFGVFLASGPQGTTIVADYAVILLMLPTILAGIVTILLLGGCVYGVLFLIASVPPYAFVVQKAFNRVRDQVVGLSEKISRAAISILSFMSAISIFLETHGIVNKKTPPDPATSQRKP